MSRERVAVVVTHLLGVGHLVRAAALGRACAAAGHDVLLVSGGGPAAHIDRAGLAVHQLPAVMVKGTAFTKLLRLDGSAADEAWLAARSDELRDRVLAFRPTALVTELYPFGRRALRAEFDALLESVAALRPRPAIVCSIRDVLAPPSRPSKAAEVEAILARGFDGVLVHGDERRLPLERSWPVSPSLARFITYTGYVDADAAASPASGPRRDPRLVIVSGGGGAAGLPLFRAAIDAARRLAGSHRFRILVGHGADAPAFDRLVGAAAGLPVTVERARPDFRDLLRQAGLSISRAGYNTVLDIAATGVDAILVPFEEGGEAEQRIRAEALAAEGVAAMIPEDELRGESLADAIRARGSAAASAPFAAPADGGAVSLTAILRHTAAARDREAARRDLEAALAEAEGEGRRIACWWRDDDAVEASPALDRLLRLREQLDVPLAIAAIPAAAKPSLAAALAGRGDIDVLVHGIAHRNHAPDGRKKQELVAGPDPDAQSVALADALARLRTLFGERCLPILVPPWNRIDPAVIGLLPAAGYRGLSAFAGRYHAVGPPGLVRLDAHVDPVDWRTGARVSHARLLASMAAQVRRVARGGNDAAPIGVLSHHLQHDPWVWAILEEGLSLLAGSHNIQFISARERLSRAGAAGRVANPATLS